MKIRFLHQDFLDYFNRTWLHTASVARVEISEVQVFRSATPTWGAPLFRRAVIAETTQHKAVHVLLFGKQLSVRPLHMLARRILEPKAERDPEGLAEFEAFVFGHQLIHHL